MKLKAKTKNLFSAPLEPILDLSRQRLLAIGCFTSICHVLFGLLWQYVIPQEYENLQLRLVIAIMGCALLCLHPDKIKTQTKWYCVFYLLVAGPGSLTWFFLMNQGSPMWTSTMCMGVIFGYQLMDWRVATLGTFTSLVIAAMAYALVTTNPTFPPTDAVLALAFAWTGALMVAASTANEQVKKLGSTMRALGVMAHELRTPLATAALLAQSLKAGSDPSRVSETLASIIRSMNHQIDSQIVNAQLIDLKPGAEQIGAMAVVQNAIDTYPFSSSTQRSAVVVNTISNFVFKGDIRLFNQVIQNLIKNALHAMIKTGGTIAPGAIQIDIERTNTKGRIRIKDSGPGISELHRRSIFAPFYSSENNYSSGLGLAFCKQVIEANHGTIWVEASSSSGTTFAITIPCL